MPEVHSNRSRRWLTAAIKLAIVVVVVWFIRRTLVNAWQELRKHPLHLNFAWLAASGGLYLLGSLLCGLFWHRVLRTLGQNVSLSIALRAYFIGHLGKYVPGKAMVVILRAGLVRGPGVEAPLAVVSVFFETLTMMSVGATTAAAIVAVYFRGQVLLFWASLGMMAVAGLPTLPPVFRRLVRMAGLGRLAPATLQKLDALDCRIVAVGWILNAVGWVILGLSYWAVLQSLGVGSPNPVEQLPLDTAAVSLATVGGFVSFVPAGAVVREAVLTELTAPHFGNTMAVVAAVLLRLVWLVAELVMAGALSLWGETRDVGRGMKDE